MQSNEIRLKFLKFFEERGHKIIPSASLVPENDPSVLFNTAGMQPLVPYLLGGEHPMGKRIVDAQKCVRTGDIDEVGDNRHLTFFEMLGNWSLGDYFKKEAIKWSFEFLTDKEQGLGLDKDRIYITVFEGDGNAPRDNEAADLWKKYIPENRIYFLPAKNNWWSAGDNGPCGPDTEIFYDPNDVAIGDMTHDEFVEADNEGRVVEIWNNVFMEYEKKDNKVIGKLRQHNVDTGMGLERITMVCQGAQTVFDTDMFLPAINMIKESSNIEKYNIKSARIIADHMRSAIFLISDGVIPGNKNQGYVLRRLIRRAVLKMRSMESGTVLTVNILKYFENLYSQIYPNLKQVDIKAILTTEEEKFKNTLQEGMKEFEKETDPFVLFTTYGFPIELTMELAREKGIEIDLEDFNRKMTEHQKLSQTASAGMFKGGLVDAGEEAKRLHTATHLLNAALRQVLGNHVIQKGSNITKERLRFDFTHPQKMTEEEKKKVEEIVNGKILEGLHVGFVEMSKAEAEKVAIHSFNEKYGDIVKVYSVGDEKTGYFSREFCGGPHVDNTRDLGQFKIQKEEAVAQGIRRIKAILV